MKRKKRSIIWSISKNEFEHVVKTSKTLTEIAAHFSLSPKGGNFGTIKRRLEEENIDYSHIPLGLKTNKGIKRGGIKQQNLSEILVENSKYRGHLKERIINEKIFEYKCEICNNFGIWEDKKLILQLDHKNGISNDNRKENLRLLCPNCHSQTDTFTGKRKRY